MARRRLTAHERYVAIQSAWKAGATYFALATEFRLSEAQVRKICRQAAKKFPTVEERNAAICAARQGGATYRALSMEFGLTEDYIRILCREAGQPKRSTEERDTRIYAARKAGATFTAIGRDFGLSAEGIRRICDRMQRIERYIEIHGREPKPVTDETPLLDLDWNHHAWITLSRLQGDLRLGLFDQKPMTLGDLCCISEQELLQMPNCGRKTIEHIKSVLAGYGRSLREDSDRAPNTPKPNDTNVAHVSAHPMPQ